MIMLSKLYNVNVYTWLGDLYIESGPRAVIQYKDAILPV